MPSSKRRMRAPRHLSETALSENVHHELTGASPERRTRRPRRRSRPGTVERKIVGLPESDGPAPDRRRHRGSGGTWLGQALIAAVRCGSSSDWTGGSSLIASVCGQMAAATRGMGGAGIGDVAAVESATAVCAGDLRGDRSVGVAAVMRNWHPTPPRPGRRMAGHPLDGSFAGPRDAGRVVVTCPERDKVADARGRSPRWPCSAQATGTGTDPGPPTALDDGEQQRAIEDTPSRVLQDRGIGRQRRAVRWLGTRPDRCNAAVHSSGYLRVRWFDGHPGERRQLRAR